jgi:hypothetical protein
MGKKSVGDSVMTIEDVNDLILRNIRFEVIDPNGRQYATYDKHLVFSVQDDNKTLKIFVEDN